MDICDFIIENKVIVICRRVYGDSLVRLSDALYEGGLRLMEVTFDQSDPDCLSKTGEAIRTLNARHAGRMRFGAGTVLNTAQVQAACDAGAGYIISPNFNPDVVRRTRQLGLASIPGAATPSEILAAHEAGADFVKLFPAAALGMRYIRDILAPINHVRLIATAGVTEENLPEFLSLGFAGAGISGRLTDRALLAAGDYEELTRRAAAFAALARGEQDAR